MQSARRYAAGYDDHHRGAAGRRRASALMARKPKNAPAVATPMSRDEWALAFELKVDELRPDMGRKYLGAIVATLWPKHRADDPEKVAVQWAAEREAK